MASRRLHNVPRCARHIHLPHRGHLPHPHNPGMCPCLPEPEMRMEAGHKHMGNAIFLRPAVCACDTCPYLHSSSELHVIQPRVIRHAGVRLSFPMPLPPPQVAIPPSPSTQNPSGTVASPHRSTSPPKHPILLHRYIQNTHRTQHTRTNNPRDLQCIHKKKKKRTTAPQKCRRYKHSPFRTPFSPVRAMHSRLPQPRHTQTASRNSHPA